MTMSCLEVRCEREESGTVLKHVCGWRRIAARVDEIGVVGQIARSIFLTRTPLFFLILVAFRARFALDTYVRVSCSSGSLWLLPCLCSFFFDFDAVAHTLLRNELRLRWPAYSLPTVGENDTEQHVITVMLRYRRNNFSPTASTAGLVGLDPHDGEKYT